MAQEPPKSRGPQQPRRPGDPRRLHPRGRGSAEQPKGMRERLRQDPFLFAMCLGFLGFTTSAFAVGWRLLGDPTLLALAVLSVLPAFALFYLRDGAAA